MPRMGPARTSFTGRPDPRVLRASLADSLRIAGGRPADRPPEFSLSPDSPVTRTGRRETPDMNAKNLASSPTTRKVVGSLGVLGAAAAVAGMGTFGTFTDSTTPIATTIASGTLSIDVTQQGFAVPVTTNNFVPGDSLTRAVNLVNDGSSPLGSVTVSSTATAASVLTTDTANGLQLLVRKCSVAWTQGGSASAPTYTCSGTETVVGSGPAV